MSLRVRASGADRADHARAARSVAEKCQTGCGAGYVRCRSRASTTFPRPQSPCGYRPKPYGRDRTPSDDREQRHRRRSDQPRRTQTRPRRAGRPDTHRASTRTATSLASAPTPPTNSTRPRRTPSRPAGRSTSSRESHERRLRCAALPPSHPCRSVATEAAVVPSGEGVGLSSLLMIAIGDVGGDRFAH